jgi:hypothetical protein
MNVEPFKYLIQPVAIERDEESGRITREVPGEVLVVFCAEDAERAVTGFEAALKQLTEGRNGDALPLGQAAQIHARETAEDRRQVGQEIRRQGGAEEDEEEGVVDAD